MSSFLSNLTVIHISCQSFSLSPAFQNVIQSNKQFQQFKFSHFSHFFAPFYQAVNLYSPLSVKKCEFRKFLSNTIQVTAKFTNNYFNKTYYQPPTELRHTLETIQIDNCRFISIFSSNSGGAILCFGGLIVDDSLFSNCRTEYTGGAIAAYSDLVVKSTVFLGTQSSYASAVFSGSSEEKPRFHIHMSCFSKCVSEVSDGTINQNSATADFEYSFSNISDCKANGDNGGITVDESETKFSYSLFSNIDGPDFNGGVSINECRFIKIECCAFNNLSRKSDMTYSGIAVHIFANRNKNSTIVGSVFGPSAQKFPAIFVRSGEKLHILSSWLSLSEDEESLFSFLLKFENCEFSSNCQINDKINFYQKEDIDASQITTVTETHSQTPKETVLDEDKKTIYDIYLHLPFTVALTVSLLYIIFT